VAISSTNVELRKDGIVATVPIDVDIQVYDADEIIVFYGIGRLVAVVDTDYSITLSNEGDITPEWPTTFSITPTASLVNKIAVLMGDDEDEEDAIWVRRQLAYTNDFLETDGFLRAKIAREFDRAIMRFQQLAHDFALITGLATAEATATAAAAAASASATTAGNWSARAAQWAELLNALVAGVGFSAKEWAIGTFTRGTAGGGSAKDWATLEGETVDDTELSAKAYAGLAFDYKEEAQAAVGGVKVTVADTTPSVLNTKVVVVGLLTKATGTPGGNETLNLTVPKASAVTLVAGTNDTDAATAKGLKDALIVPLNELYVRDEKASGSYGGSSSTTTYHTRTVNTVLYNTIPGASVTSNRITLPAGTYRIKGRAPCISGDQNKALIYNFTDSTYVIVGESALTSTNAIWAEVEGEIVLASTKEITLVHYITSARGTDGLGTATNDGSVEVYSSIKVRKVA